MKLIGRFLKALYFKYTIESIASDQLIISQLFTENSPHGKEKQERRLSLIVLFTSHVASTDMQIPI